METISIKWNTKTEPLFFRFVFHIWKYTRKTKASPTKIKPFGILKQNTCDCGMHVYQWESKQKENGIKIGFIERVMGFELPFVA